LGLQALGAKKEWGGSELSLNARAILLEEAAQHRLGLYHPAADAFGDDFPSFLAKCSEQQIEMYVKPAIKSGKSCFVALWEEQEDNHLEKLSTSAVKDGNELIINGHKSYIQSFNKADFGSSSSIVSWKMVNKSLPFFYWNLIVNWNRRTILVDVQTTHCITFKNYRVNDNQRIGAVGEGTALMKRWLAESQILLAAKSIGVSVRALEYGKQYAKLRITRGKPLAEFPTVRSMMAKAVINLQAARLMVQDAAKKVDQDAYGWELAAQMAKLQATETAAKIIDDVLQIHGGSGFAGDLPIERWYKEIRIARVNLQKAETIIENVAEAIF
jgi:acyl-CoA dehydrogenase